jgi:cation:H+ antiporter
MVLPYIFVFIVSCFLLALSSKWLIGSLSRIALYLRLKEFVVGFFIMAFAVSLPNFFVGIISAFNGIPQLSFGDVIGGNIVDLSLVIGLAALLSKGGLSAQSQTVQGSSIFTIFIGVLPMLLVSDQQLSRMDGVLLILSYVLYVSWLFSKRERFTKIYDHAPSSINFKNFIRDLVFLVFSVILLLGGARGIVASASVFANALAAPIGLIGLFIVGVGNSLPEGFFSVQAARKGQDWMILGDLMGGVVITATLVLGIVALISPIMITDFSPFAIARIFLILSAVLFLFCLRSGARVSKREGILLLLIYVSFLITEILTR